MSKHTQEQNTDRDRRVPVNGEVYTNGHYVSEDDCQAPYTQEQRQPPAPSGFWSHDENGRRVWIEGDPSIY